MKQPDWTRRTRRIFVCGPSGSGKSSWLQIFLAGWPHRVLAFDHKGEFAQRYRFPRCDRAAALPTAFARGRVAYNPHVEFEGRNADGFALAAGVAYHTARRVPGDSLFACDELQDWLGTGRGELPPALGKVLESGRGWGLHSVCLAQASNLVNCRLRQQFNELVIFQQREKRALDFLEGAGVDIETVRSLDRLCFVHANLESGQSRRGRIAFSAGKPAIIAA